ncbi:hypothetical protein I0D00_00995 [Pseudomonas lalucatii]|uniref:Uncharacterized protein n=1 Tax=Pseudomonas lalucatii TaxID=1424203 RepID=A0ABS5PVF4_9PSED|nr:hypothetical protein [Pseudomonas lalucatii]MBS7660527.1 hypothetical protein [Pseudomonas lalucatii]QVM87400.1 hypothetical protein I0D68_19935 [Pseudomonas lalucatii]
MSDITVSIQLDRQQCRAYLRWLASQYEQAMADCWYSDRYRYVPEGLRAQRVLADHPHIAGISRSARELRKLLAALGERP